MKFKHEIHHRRSIRLQDYNYSQNGAYFITICVQNREGLLGEVIDGNIKLNDAGKMIDSQWNELPNRFQHIQIDEYIVMPNHFHGIIFIANDKSNVGATLVVAQNVAENNTVHTKRATTRVAPTNTPNNMFAKNTIGNIVGAFKSITTHEYINGVKNNNWQPFAGKLWQRNYYEHIIRNEKSLFHIREYINNNPSIWAIGKDRDNLNNFDYIV